MRFLPLILHLMLPAQYICNLRQGNTQIVQPGTPSKIMPEEPKQLNNQIILVPKRPRLLNLNNRNLEPARPWSRQYNNYRYNGPVQEGQYINYRYQGPEDDMQFANNNNNNNERRKTPVEIVQRSFDNCDVELNRLQQLIKHQNQTFDFQTAFQVEFDQLKIELKEMMDQLNNSSNELTNVKTELNITKTQLTNAKTQLTNAKTQSTKAEAKLIKAEAELKMNRGELADSKTELFKTKTELFRTKAELAEVKMMSRFTKSRSELFKAII